MSRARGELTTGEPAALTQSRGRVSFLFMDEGEPMGLVLSRKVGETIIIDEKVTVEIAKTSGGKVSVNITAPPEISIRRGEIPPVDRNTCGCGDCDYCREVAPQTDQAAEQEPTATA